MNVEGIIIHKTAYKDRDLICKLLLRTGKVLNLYFYGGRGGGKKSKGSFLELGHMVKVTLGQRNNKSDILIAKEYTLVWHSDLIRTDHRAFYFMSFVFELVQKISVEESIEDYGKLKSEFEGLFKVVSNILFHMDQKIGEKSFNVSNFMFVFLAKALHELGSTPDYMSCGHCEIDLNKVDLMRFEAHEGIFTCLDCLQAKDETISGNKSLIKELRENAALRKNIDKSLKTLVKDIEELQTSFAQSELLFNYICYQFGFSVGQFKTWAVTKSF